MEQLLGELQQGFADLDIKKHKFELQDGHIAATGYILAQCLTGQAMIFFLWHTPQAASCPVPVTGHALLLAAARCTNQHDQLSVRLLTESSGCDLRCDMVSACCTPQLLCCDSDQAAFHELCCYKTFACCTRWLVFLKTLHAALNG